MIRLLPFLMFLVVAGMFLILFFYRPKKPSTRNIFHHVKEWDTPYSKHVRALKEIAEAEHEFDWLPHVDNKVISVCAACNPGKILFPSGHYGDAPVMAFDLVKPEYDYYKEKEEKWNHKSVLSSTVLTPNERRSLLKHFDRVSVWNNYKR